MGFFDELGKKVSDAGQKTIQKTKDMSETVRINSMISDEEKKVNECYCQIGMRYVDAHKEDAEAEFAELVQNVQDSLAKIEGYRKQIQDIKGITRCPQCGAEVQQGAAFCSTCGAPMEKAPEVPQEDTEDMVRCEGCGAMMKKDMSFCTQCGRKLS